MNMKAIIKGKIESVWKMRNAAKEVQYKVFQLKKYFITFASSP